MRRHPETKLSPSLLTVESFTLYVQIYARLGYLHWRPSRHRRHA